MSGEEKLKEQTKINQQRKKSFEKQQRIT